MAQNKVLKAGLGYTIGNYMLKGLSFISIPIYTRLLSTSDYGRFNNFLTYGNIFFIVVGLAIHSSYKSARYRYKLRSEGAQEGTDYYTYASASILFLLACAVIWLLVANIFASTLSNWLDMDRISLNLLIIYSTAAALIMCFNTDVSIDYEYKKFLVVSGFNAIGTILLSVALLLTVFMHQRYMGMILGASLPSILASFYVVGYFFKRAKPKNIITFMKWGVVYSLPIVPHGLSQIVLNQFDRIMITKLVSAAATGIYSFAYNIYSILAVTFNSLDNVWSSWFYEQMRARNYKGIKKFSSIYMGLMFVFAAGVILVSPEVVMILGQKNYWVAKYVAIPVVTGGYFAFLYTIPAGVEYYHAKTVWIALGTATAAILNVSLNFVFIPRYGYVAAGYTTLVTYILYFVFHFFIAWRIQGWNLFSISVIIGCFVGIIIVSVISLLFINTWTVRWLIAFIMVGLTIWYEEKNVGLIKILKFPHQKEL